MRAAMNKFKFKGDLVILHAPGYLLDAIMEVPFKTNFEEGVKSANTLVFVNNKAEFMDFAQNGLSHVIQDSILWIAYPKQSSKIKTDINRDILRETAELYSITTVAAISIDDTWSALRFRPLKG